MFSFFKSAHSALGTSLLLGGALLLNGCGGGSSGLSVPKATPTPVPASNMLLDDEFNGPKLDPTRWSVVTSNDTTIFNIQRTQLGNQPEFAQDPDGTHFMRVKLDTFLPVHTVKGPDTLSVLGTEVKSNLRFARGNGVIFETRMRLSNAHQLGLVDAFFAYGEKGTFDGTPPLSLDEIDHEMLTNDLFTNSPRSWTNIYNDFIVPQKGNPTGSSYFEEKITKGEYAPLVAFDRTGWNTYRIEWKEGSTRWFINDTITREDTSGRVPNDPLGVRFNIWAPSGPPTGWTPAWSDTLKSAATAADNETFAFDVDWVRVRTLDGKAPATPAVSALMAPSTRRGGAPMAGYRSN